jgi:predicted Rossmann-fold nucleotide-binding protein
LTWSQLGRHAKPIVLANIDRFWDPLLGLLGHMRQEAFIREGLEVRFLVVDQARKIVPAIRQAVRPKAPGLSDSAITAKF